MLREHSNRNDTLRVIKYPLFLCTIITPGNHRWHQDHILQGAAHTRRMRQAFLSSQTKREGRRRVRMRKKNFFSLSTLMRGAGAEPSSAFSVTAPQHGQYCPQVPTAAQMDFLDSCYNMRPSWEALFSDLEARGVRRGLLTRMSGYISLVCGFALYQPVWGCTWYLVQGWLDIAC